MRTTYASMKFQLTAARRRLELHAMLSDIARQFQLTAARRRLAILNLRVITTREFQLTAARRRLVDKSVYGYYKSAVSTHSRPKAAG